MSQSTDENKKRIKLTTTNATFIIIMDDKTYGIYKSYDMVLTATRLLKILEEISTECINNTGSINHIEEYYNFSLPDYVFCKRFCIDKFHVSEDGTIECYVGNIITNIVPADIIKTKIRINKIMCGFVNNKYPPRKLASNIITSTECFGDVDRVDLMMGFIYMQNAYGFDKVIEFEKHSIFGQAYLNAVKRLSEYESSHYIVKLRTPSFNDVLDELYKLLLKYKCYGYSLDESIEELYLSIESRLKGEQK